MGIGSESKNPEAVFSTIPEILNVYETRGGVFLESSSENITDTKPKRTIACYKIGFILSI